MFPQIDHTLIHADRSNQGAQFVSRQNLPCIADGPGKSIGIAQGQGSD
jgi:hypothetical protein